jgi:hypothetical protein
MAFVGAGYSKLFASVRRSPWVITLEKLINSIPVGAASFIPYRADEYQAANIAVRNL